MNTQDLRNQLDNASNVLIVLPYLIDTDAISTAAMLHYLLATKDKRVTIASTNQISAEYLEILKKANIEKTSTVHDIEPISYVVTVGGVEGKVNVSWNRNNDNVDLILVPEKGEIDFSKVTNSRQGGTYDLVLVLNSIRGEHLGRVYTDHIGLFEGYNVVSIGRSFVLSEEEKPSWQPEGYSSTCEMIFDNFEELGGTLDQNIAEITAWGMIGKTEGLQVTKSPKTFDILSILSNRFNVDLNKIFRDYYANFSKDELFVGERVIRNIKVDESRKTIYSVMTTADFNGLNYNPNSFDPVKYLTTNVKGNYKYSFIAFEKALNQTIIYIKSLDVNTSIAEIAEKLGAYPDTNAAIITFSKNAAQSVNDVLKSISGESIEVATVPETEIMPVEGSVALIEESNPEPEMPSQEQVETQVQPETEIMDSAQTVEEEKPAEGIPNQSPFMRATEIAVDPEAKPAKEQSYYSGANKPFDPAVN